MNFFFDFIQDLSIPFLAFVAGLYWYKRLSAFHRILVWQLAIYLVMDMIAINIKINEGNSGWTFNLLMPAETGLLLMAAGTIFSSKKINLFLLFLFLVFASVFFYDIANTDCFTFAYHASTVQAVLLLTLFMAIIYQLFKQQVQQSIICSLTGMSLYFAAIIPYIGVMFYIDQQDIELSEFLFEWIVIPSQILRYFLVGLGFYLEARTIKKQKQMQLVP